MPPSPGPPTCAAERVISNFEFPSMICRAVDEGGQVRLIGDVEEDLEGPDEEPDDEELAER